MLQASGSTKSMLACLIILALAANCSHSFSTPNGQLASTRSYHQFYDPSTLITKASGFLPERATDRRQKRSHTALAMSSSKIIASLHTNNNFIMSVLTILAAAGIAMEKNTTIGKAISVSRLENTTFFIILLLNDLDHTGKCRQILSLCC